MGLKRGQRGLELGLGKRGNGKEETEKIVGRSDITATGRTEGEE